VGAPLEGYALLLPHAQAHHGARGAHLHNIFVAPEARRRGHGRALLAAAEEDARARGCAYVVIGANLGNDVARATYEACGYAWREPTFWRFRKALAP
jgi:ribosomal protein S18 acetylase RimI-like enzyme